MMSITGGLEDMLTFPFCAPEWRVPAEHPSDHQLRPWTAQAVALTSPA